MGTINTGEIYTIFGQTLQDICDAVSTKTGIDDVPVSALPKRIAGIGGLDYEDIKDVMFMDYNGDVLYSYDADDFILNVNALPAGPTWHTGLTFQEWNWDLADIKDELQNGSGGFMGTIYYVDSSGICQTADMMSSYPDDLVISSIKDGLILILIVMNVGNSFTNGITWNLLPYTYGTSPVRIYVGVASQDFTFEF